MAPADRMPERGSTDPLFDGHLERPLLALCARGLPGALAAPLVNDDHAQVHVDLGRRQPQRLGGAQGGQHVVHQPAQAVINGGHRLRARLQARVGILQDGQARSAHDPCS